MAFNFNDRSNSRQQQGQDDSWKAQAFINLYLPTKEGGRRKLGTIALKDSRPNEKALIEYLQKGDAALKNLANKVEFNFQMAEGSEANGFDLGEVPAPATGTNG